MVRELFKKNKLSKKLMEHPLNDSDLFCSSHWNLKNDQNPKSFPITLHRC